MKHDERWARRIFASVYNIYDPSPAEIAQLIRTYTCDISVGIEYVNKKWKETHSVNNYYRKNYPQK